MNMEWLIIILNAAFVFILGLFIKNYLPSYMDKKGENLATKKDIAEITRRTEEVQQEFRQEIEKYTSDLHFKYDFYYKQYSSLYCKLYEIIIQSEYVRHFLGLTDGNKFTFDEVPFIEISPTHRVTRQLVCPTSESAKYSQSTEDIETPISKFNKKQLCDYIIENGEYATQELLKKAVSYRFAYSNYAGNPEVNNSSCEDQANNEEIQLIRDIVCLIVKDYNFLRKELKMEYNENEIKTGILIL